MKPSTIVLICFIVFAIALVAWLIWRNRKDLKEIDIFLRPDAPESAEESEPNDEE